MNEIKNSRFTRAAALAFIALATFAGECQLDSAVGGNINDTNVFSHPNWGTSSPLSGNAREIVTTLSPDGNGASLWVGDAAPVTAGHQGRYDVVDFQIPFATPMSSFGHVAAMAYYDRFTHDRFGSAIFESSLCVEYAIESCANPPPSHLPACKAIPALQQGVWYRVKTTWYPENLGSVITAQLTDTADNVIETVSWSMNNAQCRPVQWQVPNADVDFVYGLSSFAVGDALWLTGNSNLTGRWVE